MIINDRSIIHVNDAHQEEKPLFTGNITILDFHFPQLIGVRNLSVIGQPAWMRESFTPLRVQDIELFT